MMFVLCQHRCNQIPRNVNSTGAKPIYYRNSNIPAELIDQYTVLELVYSGSYWFVVGNMNILTKGDSINIECFTAM